MQDEAQDTTWNEWKTWPNAISIGRLAFGMLLFYLMLGVWHHKLIAIGVYTGFALVDNLDGYLARRYKRRSKLGQTLDPAMDVLYVVIACGLIAFSVSWWLLALLGPIVTREIAVIWFFAWLEHKDYEIDPTKWGKRSRFLTNVTVAFSILPFATDGEIQQLVAIAFGILLACAVALSWGTIAGYIRGYLRSQKQRA